jgi:hypothetical protein
MFSKDFSKAKAAAKDSASKDAVEFKVTASDTEQSKGEQDSVHQEEEESKDGATSDS